MSTRSLGIDPNNLIRSSKSGHHDVKRSSKVVSLIPVVACFRGRIFGIDIGIDIGRVLPLPGGEMDS